ncbi:MAG: hypothetical protein IJU25_01345 [Lachnospiraceae bacterium]|nr:hypothetical protein [Lachnospiraceae bacterium]
MKSMDMRFDLSIIRGWIGKEFKKYKSDTFDFTNSVTQIVGLYIGHDVFSITNIQESVDYFGNTDDIAVARLALSDESRIRSSFKDVDMISTPVNDTIKAVRVVNEQQKISENGDVTYDVWLTRALIISVGEREISFEKDTVPFSEEIFIRRGYNLIEECSDEKSFLEGWEDICTPECRKVIVEIKG